MSLARTRDFLLSLPRVEETLQWDRLVYRVLDKTVGGKMFAMLEPEPGGAQVMAFAVPPDRFGELLETDGVRPRHTSPEPTGSPWRTGKRFPCRSCTRI